MTYRPPYFRVDDRATLLRLIAEHPLATLITSIDNDVKLSYVPLLARQESGELFLEGHLARANDQWKAGDARATVSFLLADHYISPAWYPSKRTDPRTVPTWDYVSVQARGIVRFIQETAWLASFVRRLTQTQEARVGEHWSVDDAPGEYLETQYRAIVGIEMRVESLEGKFKLHQNHPAENISSVADALEALHTPPALQLAPFMRSLL